MQFKEEKILVFRKTKKHNTITSVCNAIVLFLLFIFVFCFFFVCVNKCQSVCRSVFFFSFSFILDLFFSTGSVLFLLATLFFVCFVF